MKTLLPLIFVTLQLHSFAQTKSVTLYNDNETCLGEFNAQMPKTQLGYEFLFKITAPEQNSLECYLVQLLKNLPGRILGLTIKSKQEYIIRLQPNLDPTDLLQYFKHQGIYGVYYTKDNMITLDDFNNAVINDIKK